MNIKQIFLSLFLGFASISLAGSGVSTDKEKKEEVEASIENAKIVLKLAVFEALFQDVGQNPSGSGPNYGTIYRRAIVVESLRGPFKAGDYVIIVTSFEGYPRGLGDVRQEYPLPECSYYMVFSEEELLPARKDFKGIFAVLNGALMLESPSPVRKNREGFLPPIEPAQFKTELPQNTERKLKLPH